MISLETPRKHRVLVDQALDGLDACLLLGQPVGAERAGYQERHPRRLAVVEREAEHREPCTAPANPHRPELAPRAFVP